MSDVEDKGRLDYSKFDKLDTAMLEAILQADFDAPEAERLEVEEILYIVNLIAERQKSQDVDVAAAKAEFYEHYYPMVERGEKLFYSFNSEDNEDRQTKIPWFYKKWWRQLTSSAALLVLLLCAGSLTAYAFGYNPVNFIASWNDDLFWFENKPVTAELAETVANYESEIEVVPEWLPDGYTFGDIEIDDYEAFIQIRSNFYNEIQNDSEKLYIVYAISSDDIDNTFYEKDYNDVTEYFVHGIKHYIINNIDNTNIIWRNNNFECSVTGTISIDEAKKIINSIYGE